MRFDALSHQPNIDNVVEPATVKAEECAVHCEKEMIFDALVGIIDPLRQDVVDAVKTCQSAGITVKAIATQAGILNKGQHLWMHYFWLKKTKLILTVLTNINVHANASTNNTAELSSQINEMGLNEKKNIEQQEGSEKKVVNDEENAKTSLTNNVASMPPMTQTATSIKTNENQLGFHHNQYRQMR